MISKEIFKGNIMLKKFEDKEIYTEEKMQKEKENYDKNIKLIKDGYQLGAFEIDKTVRYMVAQLMYELKDKLMEPQMLENIFKNRMIVVQMYNNLIRAMQSSKLLGTISFMRYLSHLQVYKFKDLDVEIYLNHVQKILQGLSESCVSEEIQKDLSLKLHKYLLRTCFEIFQKIFEFENSHLKDYYKLIEQFFKNVQKTIERYIINIKPDNEKLKVNLQHSLKQWIKKYKNEPSINEMMYVSKKYIDEVQNNMAEVIQIRNPFFVFSFEEGVNKEEYFDSAFHYIKYSIGILSKRNLAELRLGSVLNTNLSHFEVVNIKYSQDLLV
jgi:hypothetical protein